MPDWPTYVKAKLPPLGLCGGREAEVGDELTQRLGPGYPRARARGEAGEAAVQGGAVYSQRGGSSLTTGGGEPETVNVATTSANFFDVLGVRAALGRTFLPGEDQPGKTGVVVVSQGLWRRRFGADPGIVGRTV